ncbi:MAG: hypothetical protein J5865_05335 [Lachnospiraceae bacterium]|nr:hypothetical protein [Lachnospiraceae bacterium]
MKNKMKRFALVILAMAMVLSACSGSKPETEASSEPKTEAVVSSIPEKETEAPTTAAPTTEAPTTAAPTTEAPTTAAPTTEAVTEPEPAEIPPIDFDPATNKTYNVMGIEFQVPAKWRQNGQAFYASEKADDLSFLIYMGQEGVSSSMITNPAFIESYSNGLKSSFQEDAELISYELEEVAGREMIFSKLRGRSNGMEMMLDAASMAAPSGNGLVAFLFLHPIEPATNYMGDFRMILENLKDVEEVPDTSEAATEAPTEAESKQATEKKMSQAFDPATNLRYTVKGLEFQIPVDWKQNDPYFYPSTDPEQFAMVYYAVPEGTSASMLDNSVFVESYANGLASSMQNGKVIDSQMTEIGGRKMLIVDLEGELNGMELEMTFATLASPEDNNLVVFGYGQRISGEIDYAEDFLKMLENLKDVN